MSKQTLDSFLQELKPELKVNTIKSYSTQLRGLSKATNLELSPDNFMKHKNIILKHLKTLDHKKRKHLISAILLYLSKVATKDFAEELKTIMYKDIELTDEENKKQEMSVKQKHNWMTWNEVLQVREALANQAIPLMKKKTPNMLQFNRIVDYIIVCLYTYQPPRRLDYKDMRPYGYPLKDVSDEDNYIDAKKGIFVFQNYKTKGSYDDQSVKINPELLEILKLYSKVKLPFEVPKENQWLIYDTKGLKLSSPKLSQRISSIFNKVSFSANMLRHIYISDVVLPDQERLKSLENTAEAMGHSVQTQQFYKKFDDKK